jgi:hypothetical protein
MSEAKVHIDADPATVYGLVADVTRMGEWSPETVSAQWLDGASGPAVGAKFKGKNKRKMSWSTTCTVIAADEGREFAFDVGSGDTRWRYRFEPAGGGTDVTESCEILKQPGALMRFLTKLGTGVRWDEREADIQNGMEQTLANLKAKAEA